MKKLSLCLSLFLSATLAASFSSAQQVMVPAPPDVSAGSWILVDAASGKVLAGENQTRIEMHQVNDREEARRRLDADRRYLDELHTPTDPRLASDLMQAEHRLQVQELGPRAAAGGRPSSGDAAEQ